MSDVIDITDCDKLALVKKAYELSSPLGLGMLHYQPGGLSDEDAKRCIRENGTIDMDYVKGRCVKFRTFKDGDRLMTRNRWYDHSDSDLRNLLAAVGIQLPAAV